MTYDRFEDLPVWKDGIRLSVSAFRMTEDKNFRYKGDLASQLQRAALSVPNNISEGFERGTTQEVITFLYYAKGSAGEVRSMTYVMDQLEYFAHLKSEISDLRSLATSVSRQLAAWLRSLQNTDITGHRHLTDKARAAEERKKGQEEVMELVRSHLPPHLRAPR
jgi:four helix bundle protein